MISRGNHKIASTHKDYLGEAMQKEVDKCWAIIINKEEATEILGIELPPMGVIEHLGIADIGEYVPKLWLTHDLSFLGSVSKESIKSRVDKEILEPIMFRHCLLQVIHHIVDMRFRHPQVNIFIWKEDLKSSYRQMHLQEKSALRSEVRVKINERW